MSRKIFNLRSIKIGFFLLVLLTTLSVAFSFFPTDDRESLSPYVIAFSMVNEARPESSISFQPRFESPPFLLLVTLLSASLATSVFLRLRAELCRRRNRRRLSLLPATRPPGAGCSHDPLGAVLDLLQQRRYKTRVKRTAEHIIIRGEKGSYGIVGSLLFHANLLIILLGVALSSLGSFRGSVSLTEGQQFDSGRDAYGYTEDGPFYTPPAERLTFRLDRIEPEYMVNGASTVASFLSNTDLEESVFMNHKISLAGREIHQGAETGFSPNLRISRNGEILFDGFLRLAALHAGESISHRDFLNLPGTGCRIEFEFLPDAVFRNGEFDSRSERVNNPLLRVSVNNGNESTVSRWMPIGDAVSVNGFEIFFPGVRRWSQIDIVDDPGKNIMLAGVILGSLGLVLRFFCVRKQVSVTLDILNPGSVVRVNGSSEKFPAEFRSELASLRLELRLLLLQSARKESAGGAELREHRTDREQVPEEMFS